MRVGGVEGEDDSFGPVTCEVAGASDALALAAVRMRVAPPDAPDESRGVVVVPAALSVPLSADASCAAKRPVSEIAPASKNAETLNLERRFWG